MFVVEYVDRKGKIKFHDEIRHGQDVFKRKGKQIIIVVVVQEGREIVQEENDKSDKEEEEKGSLIYTYIWIHTYNNSWPELSRYLIADSALARVDDEAVTKASFLYQRIAVL